MRRNLYNTESTDIVNIKKFLDKNSYQPTLRVIEEDEVVLEIPPITIYENEYNYPLTQINYKIVREFNPYIIIKNELNGVEEVLGVPEHAIRLIITADVLRRLRQRNFRLAPTYIKENGECGTTIMDVIRDPVSEEEINKEIYLSTMIEESIDRDWKDDYTSGAEKRGVLFSYKLIKSLFND